MGYNSDFTHIPLVYETYRDNFFWAANKDTLQAIADIIQAHWRVEKKSITIGYDMDVWFLVNDNLHCGITFGYAMNMFGGVVIYDFDTDTYYAPTGYLFGNNASSIEVCMPNAQNVIIRLAIPDRWAYMDYVITAMQKKDAEGQPFKTFVMGSSVYNDYFDPRYRDEFAISLNEPAKTVRPIRQDKSRFSQVYNTNNLTRAMSTNVLYSDDTVYESNGTMYIASLDLEIINEPKSIMIDGIEYVGICFSLGYPSCYNYYFKVESED